MVNVQTVKEQKQEFGLMQNCKSTITHNHKHIFFWLDLLKLMPDLVLKQLSTNETVMDKIVEYLPMMAKGLFTGDKIMNIVSKWKFQQTHKIIFSDIMFIICLKHVYWSFNLVLHYWTTSGYTQNGLALVQGM